MHRLKQSKITDFLKSNDNARARAFLEKNKSLPRKRLTYEVDILAWGQGPYALAIEQKTQFESQKTLCVGDYFTLHNGDVEFNRNANNLFLQCCGSGYLGQAYCETHGLNKEVIPVGVVDYDLDVGGSSAKWAFHRGVFFVNSSYFDEFLNEFLSEAPWIQQLINSCN